MMVDMGNRGSNCNLLHHRHHGRGNGLDDGCNHWGDDVRLLVDLCVALVGDSVGHSLDNGHSRCHIGLVVHSGSSKGLHDGHNGGNVLDHRHNWSNMVHNWSSSHNGSDGLHHRHNRLHMLDNGCDDSLVMELSEALVRCGQWSGVHHSADLGNHWSCNHMLLDKTWSSSGNGGQGTDGDLEKNEMRSGCSCYCSLLLTKRNMLSLLGGVALEAVD